MSASGGIWGMMYSPSFVYKYHVGQNAVRLRVDQFSLTQNVSEDRTYMYFNALASTGFEFRRDISSNQVQLIHGPELGWGMSESQSSTNMSSQTVLGRYFLGLRAPLAPSWFITMESNLSFQIQRSVYNGETNTYYTTGVFNQPLLFGLTVVLDSK